MDPHKRSATIEVINELGDILATGKFGTDQLGYAAMLAAGRRLQPDAELVVVGMLVDRRDELGRPRTQTVNRLHLLLTELFPGRAKKFLSATQARVLIATIKTRDIVGKWLEKKSPSGGALRYSVLEVIHHHCRR